MSLMDICSGCFESIEGSLWRCTPSMLDAESDQLANRPPRATVSATRSASRSYESPGSFTRNVLGLDLAFDPLADFTS
jgi:hypothetical protein